MSACKTCCSCCSCCKGETSKAKKMARSFGEGLKNMANEVANKLNIAQHTDVSFLEAEVSSLTGRIKCLETRIALLEKHIGCVDLENMSSCSSEAYAQNPADHPDSSVCGHHKQNCCQDYDRKD